VTGVLLLVVVARVAIAGKISTPWILLDEIIYSEIAKSIATDGHRYVREAPYDFPSFVYPALISPACARARRRAGGLRAREDDERRPDDGRRRADVLLGAPPGAAAVGGRGRGARPADAVDALHERADERERVLPGLRRDRVGDGDCAREADDPAAAALPSR
jgi:hypothetical protein